MRRGLWRTHRFWLLLLSYDLAILDPWSMHRPLLDFLPDEKRLNWSLLFLPSFLCEKCTISMGWSLQASGGDRETNPNLLHTLVKWVAANTHTTSHQGGGFQPESSSLCCHLSPGLQHLCQDHCLGLLTEPPLPLRLPANFAHEQKGLLPFFPGHTLSTQTHGLFSNYTPHSLPASAHKTSRILMGALLPPIKGLCLLVPPLPANLPWPPRIGHTP